jgi:choline dehydrogenase-like flavoprotein
VTKLETDPSGQKIKAVHAIEAGIPQTYQGDIVVVACGALNSAGLLLRSASDKHPNGLANSSDVVGRFYMRHNNSVLMAISKSPNPTIFQKTLSINDYYFGADDSQFPLGNIQMLGKSDGEMLEAEAPYYAKWVPEISFETLTKSSIDFWVASEDLPDPNNRLTLNPNGSFRLSITPNNMEAHTRLVAKLKSLLDKIDCHEHLLPRPLYLGKDISIEGTAHQCGTVRFGKDPKTSALDLNCKAHDLDNLYVVDGSFFVSIGAVNPTLTIIANAIRIAEHLKERIN